MNSQNLHGHGGGAPYDREREMDERHRAIQQHEEMARRDQERERERERERESDRYPPAPHQSSAGSIPIHQPVASRISGAIHSPGGLLANHNGNAPPISLGAPSGPLGTFGGPLQNEHGRPIQHGGPGGANGQHQMFPSISHTQPPPNNSQAAPGGGIFGGPLQPQHPQDGGRGGQQNAAMVGVAPGGHQMPGGITQGQQPILNPPGSDEKVRYDSLWLLVLFFPSPLNFDYFSPFAYNSILFPSPFPSSSTRSSTVLQSNLRALRPPHKPSALSTLSSLYNLSAGLNPIIAMDGPQQYPAVAITLPSGRSLASVVDPVALQTRAFLDFPAGAREVVTAFVGGGERLILACRDDTKLWGFYHHFHDALTYLDQVKVQFHDQPDVYNRFLDIMKDFKSQAIDTPGVINRVSELFAGHPNLIQGFNTFLPPGYRIECGAGNDPNTIRVTTPMGTTVQSIAGRGPQPDGHGLAVGGQPLFPERGSQWQQRPQHSIESPEAAFSTPVQNGANLFVQAATQGAVNGGAANPANMERRGPVEFNHAISYVNKIKNRFQDKPEIYKQFLEILQTYQREQKPIQDVYAQVTTLFNSAPDLLEDFKQFLPESAGQARAPPGRPDDGAVAGSSHTPQPGMRDGQKMPPWEAFRRLSVPEEIAFFERVKKFLSNRSSMNEFLKLCNLFSQNIIDKNTLYHKGALFIGASPDLMAFWKAFVGVDSQDVVIDNRPAPPLEKVSLSNCRGYGPSYRLLPKRERLKPCSGRDELCNSVLNDEWASHPTWASEDSGFVAHRKNQFEEGLHRIEEERHDYDFNIEANLKCIQLLEPIAQQMLAMSPSEREAFHMPSALAGQSTSIFKRICKKIYGERGIDVVNDMYTNPFDVIPVLLARMKQKDEEWRFSQREWEKVWHAQTHNMHLKSLDHMGILVKSTDKRNLTAKHLVDVIKTKHEEQRRERILKGKAPRHQFVWDFKDKEVVLDLLRLMMLYSMHNGQHSGQEKERILDFFETFIPAFFDLPEEVVQERVPKMQPESGEEEIEDQTPAELTNGRSRRNGKKEDSAASGSKETTPEVGSANEEEMADANDDSAVPEVSNERWMPSIPKPVVVGDNDNAFLDADGELKADGFFTRPWYNFFCNQTMFVFFSIFQTLYSRLLDIKDSKEAVAVEIYRLNKPKPARDLGFTENHMTFFEPNEEPAKFWPKTLELIEDYITGEIDENRYQDVMRHYYLKNGWKLYTIQDLLKTLCRLALTCKSLDSKEKTPDLIQQYIANREREETSYQTEISARKFAEKCVKDGDLFVICWFPQKSEATIRWLQRDETTFYMDEMRLRERWQYYISSFIRVEPTEGVPRSKLQKVVLTRNLPSGDSDSDEDSIPKPVSYKENLTVSICLKSSKMIWAPGTSEYFIYDQAPKSKEQRERREKFTKTLSNFRELKLLEKMVHNPVWAKDMSPEEVQEQNKNFRKWMDEGISPAVSNEDVDMD
ncbi:hypothetical protein TrVFT333_002986 [Trichoderma virens FT-333]|nr:hypothetical protein TrVFT333_002986 [Trichoderma virens FT-333]